MRFVLAAATAALLLSSAPAFAIYDGPPLGGPDLGKWIASLISEEYGRCCDEADANPDIFWQSSKTASSGYAVVVQGRAVDVDKGAMDIYTLGPGGYGHVPVTANKAPVALAWLQSFVGVDDTGHPIIQFAADGTPEFRVRCFIPGSAN